jgi:hypothetical protein
MKRILVITILLLLSACAVERRSTEPLNSSMLLMNMEGPFVSATFADRLARLIVDEKYPKDIFLVSGSTKVVDEGSIWAVHFANALFTQQYATLPRKAIAPKTLTIRIKKSDGAIVAVSA